MAASYQSVPLELDLDAAVAAASDVGVVPTPSSGGAGSAQSRLFSCFGHPMAMDKPGLGLPSSFWTIHFRMIFGALVVVLFAVVPLARLQQIWFMPLVGVGAATLANAVPGRPTDPPCCTDSYRLTLLPPAATALGTPDSSPLAVPWTVLC